MKVKFLVTTIVTAVVMLMSTFTVSAADVTIDETNFPDAVFREYVSVNFDNEGGSTDGVLTETEIAAVKKIDVKSTEVANLKGLEYFTDLTILYCQLTNITELDVSKNTELTDLRCFNTKITELDLSNNTKLAHLYCSKTDITSLDVGHLENLITLKCSNTKIACLDLSKNTELNKVEATGFGYEIGEINGCCYDLKNIKGFDPSKASQWSNTVSCEDGVLDDFTITQSIGTSVSYKYDLGNGMTASCNMFFTLNRQHNYVDGICADCGLADGEVELENDYYLLEMPDIPEDDADVHCLEYEIYDNNKNVLGKLEVRLVRGQLIASEFVSVTGWIMVAGNEKSCSASFYEGANTDFIGVRVASWNESFGEETCTYKLIKHEVAEDIEAPENAAWNDGTKPGYFTFKLPEEAEGYSIELEYNGESVVSYYKMIREMGIDFSNYMKESGTYTVYVKSVGGKNAGNSEVASVVYEYVKPEEEVGRVQKVWWTAEEGGTTPAIMNWQPVAGAEGYEITYWGTGPFGYLHTYVVYNTEDKLATSYKVIGGTGKNFTYAVRALSGDIEKFAHSDVAVEFGEYVIADDAAVSDAVSNSTVESIVEDIEEIGIDNMADAMQNNADVLAAVKALEDELTGNKSTEIKVDDSVVDTEGMTVVGAAFNVASGSSISLNVSKPETDKEIDKDCYENAVQLDISLMTDDQAVKGKLKVPVTITMKLPEGVGSDRIVIIHYLSKGTETIYPVINDDGTITFSTTSFSTFVFANMVYYGAVEAPEDDTPEVPDTPDVPDTPVIPDTPTVPDYSDNDYEYDPKDTIEYRWAGKAGWQKVNSAWYYFNANGKLKTGWVEDTDGKWYYMDAETGKMQTGWVRSAKSGLWYYMDAANGDMKSNGWLCDPESGRWYYLDVNGAMCTSWIVVDGMWYLLDTNGAMCTGWNKVNDEWYLLGSNGAMLTGWQMVGDKEYYLDENGKCLMNTTTPDGFAVDENGAKIK